MGRLLFLSRLTGRLSTGSHSCCLSPIYPAPKKHEKEAVKFGMSSFCLPHTRKCSCALIETLQNLDSLLCKHPTRWWNVTSAQILMDEVMCFFVHITFGCVWNLALLSYFLTPSGRGWQVTKWKFLLGLNIVRDICQNNQMTIYIYNTMALLVLSTDASFYEWSSILL